jgi:hypothetical protein
MRTTILTLFIFALLIVRSNSLDHAYSELSFELLDHKPVVEVTLNGRPATFMLDTGSDLTLVDASAARSFGFKLHDVAGNGGKVAGIGGQKQSIQLATQVDLKVGGKSIFASFAGTRLSHMNAYFHTKGKKPLIGIIGADAMQLYGFVIDYESNTVLFGKPGESAN